MTIDEIYAAINPLPAMLLAKGKIKPDAHVEIEANAGIRVRMSWDKRHATYSYEREYKSCSGKSVQEAIDKAVALINELPSAEQAILHEFMGKLGKLIDTGKSDGIALDYMNPLVESMKRLSKNIITHKPAAVS